jgi:hypothetical protein
MDAGAAIDARPGTRDSPPLAHHVETLVTCVLRGPVSKARAKLGALVPAVDDCTPDGACPGTPQPILPRARRLPWADLLRRVFAEDVLVCPCGGGRSVVAFVADAGQAHSLLVTLGLPADRDLRTGTRPTSRLSSPGTTPRSPGDRGCPRREPPRCAQLVAAGTCD